MGTWTNADGLPIEFGTTKSTNARGGDVPPVGDRRRMVVDIDLTTLGDTSAKVGFVDDYELPEGALIHSVDIVTLVAADSAGDAGTLDLGVIDNSEDASGTDDDDGFDAAVAQTAIDTPGETVNADGALVGTVLDANYVLAASYDTAAFTAGEVRVIIDFTPTLNREGQ